MGVRGSRNLTLVTLSKGLATRGGMRHIRNTFTENAGRLTDSGSEAEKGGAGLEAGLPALPPGPTRTFFLRICGLGPDAASDVCTRWEKCT